MQLITNNKKLEMYNFMFKTLNKAEGVKKYYKNL